MRAHKMGVRHRDFLVKASIGNVERQFVWNTKDVLPLDFPVGWSLGCVEENICIFDQSLPNLETMEKEARISEMLTPGQKIAVLLPPAYRGNKERSLSLTIIPLEPIKPPYMQVSPEQYEDADVPRQLMMYTGIRYFLQNYRPVGPHLTAMANGAPVFTYSRVPEGFSVVAHVDNFLFKSRDVKLRMQPGVSKVFSATEFFSAVFIHKLTWYRFRAVQTPDSMPPIEKEESELEIADLKRFQVANRLVISLLMSVAVLMAIFRNQLDPPPVISTHIQLQAPKYIPHQEIVEKPKPSPTPEPVKPPEPIPQKVVEQKIPEPPKPKPKIKKLELPPKKIVKKEPPPKPVEAAPAPKLAKKPEPNPPRVKAENPPATGVVVKKTEAPPPPDPSQQLLKQLSFLSSGSKNTSKGAADYSKNAKKDFMQSPTLGGGDKNSQVLDSISAKNGDASIKTRSSRTIGSDVGFGGQAGKGLNSVQGKVSLNQIYGGGGSPGDFAEGSGIAISGSGSLSEEEIEKALQKYLSKFQFCYEKALMSDSTLSGNIRLQWTIGSGGHTTDAKVIQSQMRNDSLHSCIIGVLRNVPFPSPRGGSVTAKKTFSFKATSI